MHLWTTMSKSSHWPSREILMVRTKTDDIIQGSEFRKWGRVKDIIWVPGHIGTIRVVTVSPANVEMTVVVLRNEIEEIVMGDSDNIPASLDLIHLVLNEEARVKKVQAELETFLKE